MNDHASVLRSFQRIGDEPILLVHEHERGRRLIERLRGRRPLFVCTVAHTETAEIDGLSAAGVTAELRRLTAAADTEALHFGRPLCMDGVPSNPLGAPGPVIITIAALRLAGIPFRVIDAGLRVKPAAPTTMVSAQWGESILTGRAVPHVAELLAAGRRLGRELRGLADYLILAESVPAGTTTALAVLCGLGIDAFGKVSSSMPGNAHELKETVVRAALAAAGLQAPGVQGDRAPAGGAGPLRVIAGVGDPMQPVVAGMVLGALPEATILLAGGTQMVAVLALAAAVAESSGEHLDLDRVAIATTGWVARDPTADLAGLAAAVASSPVLASDLCFGSSRYPALRRYEQFLVKEGVGAGGAALAAMLATGLTEGRLLAEIESVYEYIRGSPPAQPS